MTAAQPAPILGSGGYAVLDDVLTARQIRRIRRFLRSFDLAEDHGFFASPTHAHGTAAQTFDRKVKRLLSRRLAAAVPGYRPFMVAVTSKGASSAQAIKYHQDWTYTDERDHRPVFLWCPLVDVDAGNGALHVVPGSHQWSSAIRPSRRIQVTEQVQDLLEARGVAVPMRAGQALAFDPALCHGSPPNPTPTPRPAITIAFAPIGAQLVHFHLDDDDRLAGFAVDDAFFTTNPYGTEPVGRPPIEPWGTVLTADELLAGLRAPEHHDTRSTR